MSRRTESDWDEPIPRVRRHDPLTPTEADEHGYWRAELRGDEADLRREHRDE